jgi:hypothetical protein
MRPGHPPNAKEKMVDDRRYLKMRGTQWYAILAVPRPLRGLVGDKRLMMSLRTDSLTEARRRRWTALAALQARLDEVRKRAKAAGMLSDGGSLWPEADRLRTAMAEAQEVEDEAGLLGAETAAEAAAGRMKPEDADRFAAVVRGDALVTKALEPWLRRSEKDSTLTFRPSVVDRLLGSCRPSAACQSSAPICRHSCGGA